MLTPSKTADSPVDVRTAAFPRPSAHAMIGGTLRSGFTLVEVLISTAILLVIVMLVSMVFQQQSGAIQAGQDRVKGQSALRNAMGIMVRDLSLAVNSTNYPNLPKNSFGGSSMSFLATTGDASENGTALQRISYNCGGSITRNVQSYVFGENGLTPGKFVSAPVVDSGLKAVSIETPSGDNSEYPSYVKITASYQGSGSASTISGQSAGPDKRWDTDDDIQVGKGNNE